MEITSKHLVSSRAASNLPPLKTSVIVLDAADGPDRNIHVGGGGGGAVAAAGGGGVAHLLDWLLKQPRSHFVQKESRTCRGLLTVCARD